MARKVGIRDGGYHFFAAVGLDGAYIWFSNYKIYASIPMAH
jgi:hypothetical protein